MDKAIRAELAELRLKLIFLIYLTKMRLGTFDRNLLNWMKPIAIKYTGADIITPILKVSILCLVLMTPNSAQCRHREIVAGRIVPKEV